MGGKPYQAGLETSSIPGIPAFNGVPFLTGVGEDALIDRMIAALETVPDIE